MPDVERSYPRHLAARVRAGWPAEAAPLPARLEVLLDTAYHASFLRDEERPVACRILVLPPSSLPPEEGPPTGLLPLPFESPRRFDEDELRRLSPAANVNRALIGVEDAGEALVTWGLVQSGPRWLQGARGGRAREPPMPRTLVIRVVRPGHVIVACGSRNVAELRGGHLSDFTLDIFQSQWLPALFEQERRALVAEYLSSGRAPLDADVAATLSGHLGRQMLKRVIATIRASHHGGTVIVGPPHCMAERFLQIKYPFRDSPSRRRYRALLLEILATVAAAEGPPSDPEVYLNDPHGHAAELDEGLFETSHLIAALAQVDGAVLLTKRFEILGFGAEIAGSLPLIHDVRRGLDLEATRCSTEVVEEVGTRHRSAYRLCAAVPGTLAIVVSQDGGVRFVTQHHGAVTYWDHGAGD